jgi:hypothetical protein
MLLDKGAADESNLLAGLACMIGDLIGCVAKLFEIRDNARFLAI